MKPVPFIVVLCAVAIAAFCVPTIKAYDPSPCEVNGNRCQSSGFPCIVSSTEESHQTVDCCEDLDRDRIAHITSGVFRKYSMIQNCPGKIPLFYPCFARDNIQAYSPVINCGVNPGDFKDDD